MYHILIVEDDKGLNHGIMLALKEEGTEFYSAYTIGQAQEIRKEKEVDMVLLDVNLPDGSGFDLLREIRQTSEIPVLIITANDMEIDEVTGLSLGADDYITKPFSLMVLRARVARMRERTKREKESDGYKSERYSFAFEKMCFCGGGRNFFKQNGAEAFAAFCKKSGTDAFQGKTCRCYLVGRRTVCR